MAVVEMESLFSTSMPSFLEASSRTQLADQNELTEIAYEMINVTEHFATDFQEFKVSTGERIDKIERLIWENVMVHDTVQTEDMKQQVELLQNENNRLQMESESLLKVIELLSVQQINTREINNNAENFITVKETRKNKKTKLNHQQYHRFPLRNLFEIILIEECQDKLEPTDEDNSMLLSFYHAPSKRKKSSQLNTTNNQRLTLLMSNIKNPLNRGKHV